MFLSIIYNMQQVIFAFLIIITSGVIFRIVKPNGLDADKLRQSINTSVFNLFLPALCIKVMSKAPISLETATIPITAVITLSVMTVLSLIVYKILSSFVEISHKERGALILTAVFGNVTYLGLPVITGLYGEDAARYALYYDLLATTPFLWTVGARLSAHFGGKESPTTLDTLRKLLLLPPLWGIFIGMTINVFSIPMPTFIFRALEMLGSVVVPLMMFSIGLALSFVKPAHVFNIIPACVLKLIISPCVGYLIGKILGLSGVSLSATSLESGMPSMVLSLLVASVFGLDATLTAFVIVVTTVFSFLTMPIIVHLVG